ncbi:MAG TPA: YceI family protein [Alphaproteobacteria bacterium]|nr:YceI family protein [Alphaproteobacteria bacterium]
MNPSQARFGGLAVLVVMGALALYAGPAPAADALPVWAVDGSKSRIVFIGRQMGAASKGWFKTFTATIRFDPKNLAASKAEVLIEVASAYTGNKDIDAELRKEKWFDAARFPTARFVTTAIRAKGENAYEASGKLTIRNITRDVVLPFKVALTDGGKMAKIIGKLTIKRTEFGIGRGEWGATRIVADEVVIQIEVVAAKGG